MLQTLDFAFHIGTTPTYVSNSICNKYAFADLTMFDSNEYR